MVPPPSNSSPHPAELRPHTVEVRHAEAIKALFDNKQRTLLAPFFEPVSIAEAAVAVDALPTTVLQYVRRMVKFGVVTRIDIVRRHGKRVQRYQTVADELFVPLNLCEEVMLLPEKRFHALYTEAMREEFLRYHYNVQPIGAVVRRLPNGVIHLDGKLGPDNELPDKGGPLVTFEWSMLRLDDANAREFQAELRLLIRKFRQLPYGDRPFYFGMHFAPVPEHHALRAFVNKQEVLTEL